MKHNDEKAINIYLAVAYTGIILFVLATVTGGGFGQDWLVVDDGYGHSYSDHFRHVVYSSDLKNLYFNTADAAFPPFAYLLYRILYRIYPGSWGVDDWKLCMAQGNNMLIFIALVLMTVLLYMYACNRVLDRYKPEKRLLFVIATVMSAPIIGGALEMGNIAFLVTVMLILAFCFKDSENAVLREAALILIAMAAGLKIYPAIAGLVYVRERRWKETVRLVIYGMVFFFLPFVFCGGIPSFIQYLRLLFFFENLGERSWTNVRNYLLSISDLLGLYERSASFVKYFKIIENLFFLLCAATIFRAKQKWKSCLYTAGIMSLYIPFSYRYVSSYMLIPLVFFLKEAYSEEIKEYGRYVYAILFGLTFTIPVWGALTPLPAEFFIFTPIYIMMIFSFCQDWFFSSKA